MNSSFAHHSPGALLAGFSVDLPGRNVGELARVRPLIPPGSRVHLGFTDSDDAAARVGAARAIRQSGFEPVAIISARRVQSERVLREYLAGLQAAEASGSVLVVAGDLTQPRGPYPDAISVIGSGLLEEHGVQRVSVAGHPGGLPVAPDEVLWQALADKAGELEKRGLAGGVSTQFGFDAGRALAWLAQLRARGFSLPVRVGVPGPAGTQRLLWYACRCDVTISEAAARQYGISLTDPSGTAGPGRFIQALASGYDPRLHGEMKLHFFAFSGFTATVEWISEFRGSASLAQPGGSR